MSHKQSKRIRRVLRAQRINPDERSYDILARNEEVVRTPGSGRDLYQRAKKEMRS